MLLFFLLIIYISESMVLYFRVYLFIFQSLWSLRLFIVVYSILLVKIVERFYEPPLINRPNKLNASLTAIQPCHLSKIKTESLNLQYCNSNSLWLPFLTHLPSVFSVSKTLLGLYEYLY